jgi:hypothetical protein
MLAGLLNGVVWLTPPPIHFIALLMPFFSGYAIASSRHVNGLLASIEIGLVMGLTLGSTAMAVGILSVVVASLLLSGVTAIYLFIVIILGLGIGSYTAMAACIGALIAAHRASRSPGEGSGNP